MQFFYKYTLHTINVIFPYHSHWFLNRVDWMYRNVYRA